MPVVFAEPAGASPQAFGTNHRLYAPALAPVVIVSGQGLLETTRVEVNGQSRPFTTISDEQLAVELDPADESPIGVVTVSDGTGESSVTISDSLPAGETPIFITITSIARDLADPSWDLQCGGRVVASGLAFEGATAVVLLGVGAECHVGGSQGVIDAVGTLVPVGGPFDAVVPDHFRRVPVEAAGPQHVGLRFPARNENHLWVFAQDYGAVDVPHQRSASVTCGAWESTRPFAAEQDALRFVTPSVDCTVALEGVGTDLVQAFVRGDGLEGGFVLGPTATARVPGTVSFTVGRGSSPTDGIALGVPGEDVGNRVDAGAVHVVPVGLDGTPSEAESQLIHQGRSGLFGIPEAGDLFGAAVVQADFNRDGWADLAIGVPGEGLGSRDDAGMVQIVYGGPDGFRSDGMVLHQDVPGVAGVAEAGDRFGASLAAFDFNRDGVLDLAVGSPGEAIGNRTDAGAVHVFLGTLRGGLAGQRSLLFTQSMPEVFGVAEQGDGFGSALAGGFGFLVAGSPGEDIGVIEDAGMAHVILGEGPIEPYWQGRGALGLPEAGDRFGSTITVDDRIVVFGVPDEDIGELVDAGWVEQAYFTGSGLQPSHGLSQDRLAQGGGAESGDRFGSTVHLMRVPELLVAVGVPGEDQDAGMLQLWEVGDGEWNGWQQGDIAGETTAQGNRFGESAGWTVRGGLIIGAPGSDGEAGTTLLTYNGTTWWRLDQDNAFAPGAAEAGDRFGSVTAR